MGRIRSTRCERNRPERTRSMDGFSVAGRARPGGRPGTPPSRQPGRGQRPVGLPPGPAAAGLADPGRGRADGDRGVDLGPAAAARSTRPRPRSRSSRPSSTRSSRRWSRTTSAGTTRTPGDVRPQPDRPAPRARSWPRRWSATRPGVRGQPARRPGPGADPQRPPGPPVPQDEHDRRHPRGQGPGADQEAAGSPARWSSRTWPQKRQRRQDRRHQGLRQTSGWRSSRRTSSKLDKRHHRPPQEDRTIGPGGKNIFEEQYVNLGTCWPTSRCGSAS